MRACLATPTSVTPVWLMRRRGATCGNTVRSARAVVSGDLRDPDLVTQITVYAVERLRVDTRSSSPTSCCRCRGPSLPRLHEGGGTVIDPPLRAPEDVDRLREPDLEESVGYVFEASAGRDAPCRRTFRCSASRRPFTLAS